MRVMMIQGKVENIFDNEDFARMLGERLGSDAERYFRDETDPGKDDFSLSRNPDDRRGNQERSR